MLRGTERRFEYGVFFVHGCSCGYKRQRKLMNTKTTKLIYNSKNSVLRMNNYDCIKVVGVTNIAYLCLFPSATGSCSLAFHCRFDLSSLAKKYCCCCNKHHSLSSFAFRYRTAAVGCKGSWKECILCAVRTRFVCCPSLKYLQHAVAGFNSSNPCIGFLFRCICRGV